MNTEIYYFSGTGNSLHVAKELQKCLPEAKLIPMVSLLDREVIKTEAEAVGFIFPLYLTTAPFPVREFFKKLDLKNSKYFFAIVTRLGTICLADIYIKRMLKKQGKKLDVFFLVNMANNSPTGLKPTVGDKNWINEITKEKIAKMEAVVQERLNFIQKIIFNKEEYLENKKFGFFKYFLEFILSAIVEKTSSQIDFYADLTCISCDLCEKVCPAKKIKIINNRPAWQKNIQCYYCYACFNFCPKQSILVRKKYTDKNGRYHHPGIIADDIISQKIKAI